MSGVKRAFVDTTVRLIIDMPKWANEEDAVQQAIQEMDYNFSYSEDQVFISEHEIKDISLKKVETK